MSGRVIELALGVSNAGPAQAPLLRDLVDRCVALLRDWLIALGDPDRIDLADKFNECRGILASGATADEVEALLGPCLDAAKSIVTEMQLKQVESRNEMTALVAVVREAVAAVTHENSSLNASLNESTDRFAAVAQYNDIHKIKSQIVAEVSVLKRVIAERQKAWEAGAALLNERVGVLERQLQTSRHEASLDPLTHIANRRTFDRTCLEWMAPGQSGFVLAVLDIDGFKAINDHHGHAQGDRALVALAETLKNSVRAHDLVARLGGDEFALLMTGLTLRQAEFRLKTVIAALASSHFPGVDNSSFTLTVSCGAAEFSAGDTPASLIHRADEALYQAKNLGKNRVVTKASPFLADLMKRR